ncbi:hypothetical protein RB653_009814 [Dictyostelium firmibasis]|uniref:Conserved oligomeric Golgi complex subunit 8 n=1 Tax=Dictyostelium firmibasis TaxID=79012 RepID=A0AAN7YLH7_9MYCE
MSNKNFYENNYMNNNNDNKNGGTNSLSGSSGGINSLSFEKLLREPSQITELKSKTIKEMQKLALDHYQLFIENYKTLNYTVSKIQNVSNQIENGLLSNLPTISSSCESFSSKSHSLTERRSSIKNLLDNFATLLDILEIPQLMDTCIKNNSFDEALQLESFAKKIYKQYSNNTVIIEIIKEIKICTRSLISTLQQQLRQDITLTNCIKTIGYLRRLSIYKENELKIIFLHSRDQWLINSLKFDITDSNHVTYLTKLTDSCRTNIFDIVTQYNAIFSNESNDEEQLDDLILYNWIQQKIKIYINVVDSTLNHIKSGSSISYVLENSMYFSMSISRVGIDFRNLLEPIFEKHILNNFLSQITTANHHFLETLKTYKFPLQKSTTSSSSSSSSTSSSQYVSPPLSILQHQPLAVLVNLILKSFNELKDCFPVSLRSIVILKLKELIISIVGGVSSFYNQQLSNTISTLINTTTTSAQPTITSFDKVFHSFCKCLAEDFIPFIVKCFDIISSQQQQQQQQQQTNDNNNNNNSNSIGIDVDSLVLSLKKIYSTEPQTIPSNHNSNLPPIPDLILKGNKNLSTKTSASPSTTTPTPTTISQPSGEQPQSLPSLAKTPDENDIIEIATTNNTKVEEEDTKEVKESLGEIIQPYSNIIKKQDDEKEIEINVLKEKTDVPSDTINENTTF